MVDIPSLVIGIFCGLALAWLYQKSTVKSKGSVLESEEKINFVLPTDLAESWIQARYLESGYFISVDGRFLKVLSVQVFDGAENVCKGVTIYAQPRVGLPDQLSFGLTDRVNVYRRMAIMS